MFNGGEITTAITVIKVFGRVNKTSKNDAFFGVFFVGSADLDLESCENYMPVRQISR